MTTSQMPRGGNTEFYFKDQTDFKTAATGNYSSTVAYTYEVAEDEPIEDDPILGTAKNNTRDSVEFAPGLLTTQGQIMVPLDFSHAGYWLKSAFGAPVTTGAPSDYSHVFKSGAVVLPAKTIERKLLRSGGSIFLQHIGVMVNGLSMQVSRQAGYQRMSLDCVGYSETKLASTGAGTPVAAVARDPIAAAIGVYKIDGVQAALLEVNLNFSNNMPARDELGDARVSGFDIGEATLGGSMRLRFRDTTIYDMAIAKTEHAGEVLFYKSATRSFKLEMPNVRLQRVGVPITGPGFIDQTYNFRCKQDASDPMLTATLLNAVASY